MKKIYSHIIYTCLSVILFAGCSINYPDNDFWGKIAFENSDARVPLLVAIDDILDTFDNVKDDATNQVSEEWANEDIFVYGFYTPTDVYGAPNDVNYSERMDSQDEEKIYCLIDDAENDNIGHGKKARLNRDLTSFLQWTDNDVVYYNSIHPEYTYKFFAYYLGDAADMSKGPVRDVDSVTYEISIDGTQNLMCGYTTLCPYSAGDSDAEVFPVFEMIRQLVSVKFNSDSRVQAIKTNAPYRGHFVVAANDEARVGVTFDSAETKEFSSEEIGMNFLLPESDCYELQILTESGDVVSKELKPEGGLKAGQEYMVNISVDDSGNIELDVE